VRRGGTGDAPETANVERHDLGPELVIGFGEHLARDERAGVVEQHVNAAEKRRRSSHELRAIGSLRQVGTGMGVAPAERFGLAHGAGCVGAAVIVHKHIAAGGEEMTGDGEADALGAAVTRARLP